MARRLLVLAAVGAVLVTAPARADDRVIPPGVSAGGVDLSNLTVDAAAARLSAVLAPKLSATLTIGVAARSFQLDPASVGLRFDAAATAQGAYQAATSRPAPAPGTAPAPLAAPLVVSQSQPDVKAFVRRISNQVDRAPRNARVRITLRHIYRRRSRLGYYVARPALVKAITQTLDDPAAPRALHVSVVKDRPKITTAALPHHYRAIVTIDRAHFRLRLFVHLRFARSYRVAVGRVGLATPAGLYHVQEKQVNPAWHVPNASWAGALAGHTIPGGAPNNPLRARWLGLGGGVGIHGTSEDWSIGSRASHGCIRMHVRDVIALYRRVPVGSPVLIR